jgi:hypothetical protein
MKYELYVIEMSVTTDNLSITDDIHITSEACAKVVRRENTNPGSM